VILVTGAAGKTGKSIIKALDQKGCDVRAFVRRDGQVEHAAAAGAAEIVVGDLLDEDFMHQAMRGVRKVYHICPNVSPDEIVIGKLAIEASKRNEIEHFVYHSVLHPQVEKMPHHWLKMRVEEEIFESNLPFTILQPAPYMQNILAGWSEIVSKGEFSVPYRKETRISMVDLEDVSQAAATVLTTSGHMGAVYELSGPETLSQTEIAAILTERLGTIVQVKVINRVEWERAARNRGVDGYQVDALLKMFEYYERFGLVGNSSVLNRILGHPSSTFSEFVNRIAARDR
jgi:uncharacterized protein YbjT (DUF2867 family)